MSSRTYSIGPQSATKYTKESVERALTHHFGPQGVKQDSWLACMDGGYSIVTGIGVIKLRSLRDAALFVIGMAEGQRRAAAATDG